MPISIDYFTVVRPVALTRSGKWQKFKLFHLTDRAFKRSPKRFLNAYAIRDEFLRVKTPSEALEFLSNAGRFGPGDDSITWERFERWQRLAYLVQEHNVLASAMSAGRRRGEAVEVLKLLVGDHRSSFFESCDAPESPFEADFRAQPEYADVNREYDQAVQELHMHLCSWFREPPSEACSIMWLPRASVYKRNDDFRRKNRPGTLPEYLLPHEDLNPFFSIEVSCALEAIAAAIYVDRIQGTEYRTCSVCSSLFELGAHKDRKYCDRERCKNTANQRRVRAKRSAAKKLQAPVKAAQNI